MVDKRKGMLLVAVLAIGLFALPSALSMFAGQHAFYVTSTLPCYKCHQAEYGELNIGGPHSGYSCQYCHQANSSGYNATNVPPYFSNMSQHAAISIQCVACHANVRGELNNSVESHRPFYVTANETWTTLEGANEACIMCHTHAGVNITFTRWEQMNFTATQDDTGAWTLGNLGILNSSYSYSNASYRWGSSSPTP